MKTVLSKEKAVKDRRRAGLIKGLNGSFFCLALYPYHTESKRTWTGHGARARNTKGHEEKLHGCMTAWQLRAARVKKSG